MAGTVSRQTYRASEEYNEADYIIVAGSFETNGATGNEPVNIRGKGFTVVDGGVTGVYDVTFSNPYPMQVSMVVTVEGDAASTLEDLAAQVGAYNSTTGVQEILTYDVVATPALTAGNGPRVSFVAYFHKRNSLSITHA